MITLYKLYTFVNTTEKDELSYSYRMLLGTPTKQIVMSDVDLDDGGGGGDSYILFSVTGKAGIVPNGLL